MPINAPNAPNNRTSEQGSTFVGESAANGRHVCARFGTGRVAAASLSRRAQLIYASSGVMTVSTRVAAYVVPTQRAVWMPGGIEHRIEARSDVAMRTLYFDPEIDLNVAAVLPTDVCVLRASPLLRELILAAVSDGPYCPPGGPQSRLMSVIIDQLCMSSVSTLALPMPAEPRLLRLAEMLIANPADARSLGEWAREVGTSKRTLGRLFTAQTGMSFRTWRQQRRLLRALELLATGDNVTVVAFELGYESASRLLKKSAQPLL